MKRTAFTLVELLVTIAIVVILMAILMPILTQVRTKVNAYAAGNGLRQIGMAVNFYLSDNDGVYPQPYTALPGDYSDINQDGTVEWYEQVWSYVESPKVFRARADLSDPNLRPCSFAVNSWFDYGLHESTIRDPSDTIYLTEREDLYPYDFIEWWTWLDGAWPPDPNSIPIERARPVIDIERYNGFCNYLYVDGHVKARKFEHTWSPRCAWWPQAPPDPPAGRL
jgi:prepilin-type N-terminal cleavage/methylation domain-containing protein/prepilin-type processing-associated H-X9-DG protein